MKKTVVTTAILVFALILIIPLGLYFAGLSNISKLPHRKNYRMLNNYERNDLIKSLSLNRPIEITKLNPYNYFIKMQNNKANKIIWAITRKHNSAFIKNKKNLYWHLSGASLGIWLTQNFSKEEIERIAYDLLVFE